MSDDDAQRDEGRGGLEEIYRETERIYREIIAICSEFKRGIENAGAIGDEEEGVDADRGGRGGEGARCILL